MFTGVMDGSWQKVKNQLSNLPYNHNLKVKTSFGNAPLSKNEMEALITNPVKEYVLTIKYVIIQILPGNCLLIDIFGKILYLFGPDRYRACVVHLPRSPMCTVYAVYSACNFTKTGPNFLSF